MKSYFAAYDDFAQIQFIVTSGLNFDNFKVSSSNFDSTRMFYGNAFESFSTLVEYFAYLNNLNVDREFDEFATMTRANYISLDKASRFRCFEANLAFTDICREADNTLRNASHHGGFIFNTKEQNIAYRAGKGGQGDEQHISYTDYLHRCVKLFMQSMVLFRLELVLAKAEDIRHPL